MKDKMKLFQYAILCHSETLNNGPHVVQELKSILAKDEKQASMLAARQIPEEYIKHLSDVEILVRPF